MTPSGADGGRPFERTWIAAALRDIHAAAIVERNRDGIPGQGLGGRELDPVAGLELEARYRFVEGQWSTGVRVPRMGILSMPVPHPDGRRREQRGEQEATGKCHSAAECHNSVSDQ